MKHPLEKIELVALDLWKTLKPFCFKIKIAGSIRRRQPYCKDIEIVLLPNGRSGRNNIGAFFLAYGKVLKGKFTGRYVKCQYKGFAVDLFIPQAHDFYRQLAIRTGSANYAKRIAVKWCDLGYAGTDEGLKHRSLSMEFEQPLTWNSEREFFEFLEMDYLEPVNRN